jgi:signal transduction histidine kinase
VQLTHLAEESRQATLLEERNRMAREIHDTLAQAFTGIFMQLQAASRFLASKPEQTQLCINRAQNLAREGLAEARRSVWYLHQEDTEDGNLLHTLTRITEQLTAGTSVQAKVYLQGTPYCLSSEVGMNLLQIAQESITNALRHAQAQMIHISLSYQSERVQLRVWDDGKGFNQQRQAGSGFGLKGMRQRAQCIGACLEINTQPQAGTKVTVTVPIAGKLNNYESRTTDSHPPS